MTSTGTNFASTSPTVTARPSRMMKARLAPRNVGSQPYLADSVSIAICVLSPSSAIKVSPNAAPKAFSMIGILYAGAPCRTVVFGIIHRAFRLAAWGAAGLGHHAPWCQVPWCVFIDQGVDMAGIIAYGAYIPWLRLERKLIAESWGIPGAPGEIAVANFDEDSVTMGVEAARDCIG